MLSQAKFLFSSIFLVLALGSTISDGRCVRRTLTSTVRKAGLAWPNWSEDQPGTWAGYMGNSWYYTWSAWWTGGMEDLEFVPILWGWDMVGDFEGAYPFYTQFDVKCALFVNEPNNAGQANMDAQSGCNLWTQQFEQLRTVVPGIQLGSAAPDNSPSGKQWLLDFDATCPENKPDFIALHWYGTNHLDFQAYILDIYETFQKPIWVTEYACSAQSGEAECTKEYIEGDFFNGTTMWMIGRPEVTRFSEFGAMPSLPASIIANALMDSNGGITDLGVLYANSENL